jgi:hypothetical protein
LSQADLERGALDVVRLSRIGLTVNELASDLADQGDRGPVEVAQTEDTEAVAAIEDIPPANSYPDTPVLAEAELAPEWRSGQPVLCLGGRTALDEAAAILLAQLSTAHELAARVEGTGRAIDRLSASETPGQQWSALAISLPTAQHTSGSR